MWLISPPFHEPYPGINNMSTKHSFEKYYVLLENIIISENCTEKKTSTILSCCCINLNSTWRKNSVNSSLVGMISQRSAKKWPTKDAGLKSTGRHIASMVDCVNQRHTQWASDRGEEKTKSGVILWIDNSLVGNSEGVTMLHCCFDGITDIQDSRAEWN